MQQGSTALKDERWKQGRAAACAGAVQSLVSGTPVRGSAENGAASSSTVLGSLGNGSVC